MRSIREVQLKDQSDHLNGKEKKEPQAYRSDKEYPNGILAIQYQLIQFQSKYSTKVGRTLFERKYTL